MMDDWLLGLESFALFGHQLGAQKPIDSERASKPACLPPELKQQTDHTEEHAKQTDEKDKGRGFWGFGRLKKKCLLSLSEYVFGKTPNFFPFFSHTFQTPVRLHQ